MGAIFPVVVEALKDNESGVRSSAAEALGRMGPAAEVAVPALIEALKDNESDVRNSAAEALKRIQTVTPLQSAP
jgi:HEAT repeat protein